MQAKVNLINSTPMPIETMCWARRVMHFPVPNNLKEIKKNPKKWLGMSLDKYVENILLKDGMPTFLEYVNLTFKLENVSRALQQQLTRYRIGFSYSIQSLRCVDLPNFADDKKYYNPYKENSEEYKEYHFRMLDIQENYKEILMHGVNIQNARGLLPLNIYSTITFSCSLRAFIGLINKRLCWKVQDEFNNVAKLMLEEVKNKMDKRILNWIGKPCDFGKCMMQGENEEQYNKKILKGKQNTQYCCPNYIKKFKK